MKNLHQVFRWAVGRKMMEESPAAYGKRTEGAVRLNARAKQKPIAYTAAEYEWLVGEAERRGDDLLRDMLIVFADTGMRYEEVTYLKPECLCWNEKVPYIEIRAREDWTPKDPAEVKLIPMTPQVQGVLRRRTAKCSGGYVFANQFGLPVSNKEGRNRLSVLLRAGGIKKPRLKPWHAWRCFYVKRCLKDWRMSVPAVMKITGHDSFQMVMHYAELSTDEAFDEFLKVTEKWGKDGKAVSASGVSA